MRFVEEDYALWAVKDFAANSPVLQRIDWTSRSMAGLIRSKVGLEGSYDSNRGGWMTSKHAIMQALLLRNKSGLASRIDLTEAYHSVSPVRIYRSA